MNLTPAKQPTMHFIGVTTGKSSIMRIFPHWAKALGREDAVLNGIDIPIHADPEVYRETVAFLKNDPLTIGALVTTHKIDLYTAAKDMFEYSDPYAAMFGELSSISKQGEKLCAHAKDPISCGLAMEEFIPPQYWAKNKDAGVFIMGAGGSAISMCAYFLRPEFEGNRPAKLVIANRSQPRLEELEKINRMLNKSNTPCEYHLTPEPGQNDEVLATMPEGSLIINATGLGKDRPGSPLVSAPFPKRALVWEINYRGDLLFMHQAEAQREEKGLTIEDGWMYFIYGWTQVVSEVFHQPIEGELLHKLDALAAEYGK